MCTFLLYRVHVCGDVGTIEPFWVHIAIHLARVVPCLLDRLSRTYRRLRCVGASSSTTLSSGCLRLGRVQGGQIPRLLVVSAPALGASLQSLSVSASSLSFVLFSLLINKAPTHTPRRSSSVLVNSARAATRLPILPQQTLVAPSSSATISSTLRLSSSSSAHFKRASAHSSRLLFLAIALLLLLACISFVTERHVGHCLALDLLGGRYLVAGEPLVQLALFEA